MHEDFNEEVEALRRLRILEATNEAYAAMRANPNDWEAEQAERNLWNNTLCDGLLDP